MATRAFVLTAALLLGTGGAAVAQPITRGFVAPNVIDLGVRFADISGDEARFQRFGDLGDGAFLDRLRAQWEGDNWHFAVAADHAGRRDQRYTARYNANGTFRLVFEWDQVPLNFSRDSRTLFTVESPGVLRIDDAIQQGIQGGQLTLGDVVGQVRPFDLTSRRDTARLGLLYTPVPSIDVKMDLTTSRRDGTRSQGGSFGFGNIVEVIAPIDMRTTDLSTGVAWSGTQGMLSLGYDGSWFDNRIPALVWDNPLRFTDAQTAGAEGRSALWPGSTMHSVSTAGALKLPARSRYAGSVTVGSWSQDEPLLPFTTNTLAPALPLPRTTADAEARTVAMYHSFTSRPNRHVSLNARFRYYDFDDRRPEFLESYIRLDEAVVRPRIGPEPFGHTRRNFDVDASFTPVDFTSLKVGYGRNWTDREHRIFARTTEDVYRASVDSRRLGMVTLRALVERAERKGSRFDQDALTVVGEQPTLRHLDVADRERTRVTGSVHVTPAAIVAFSASAAAGKDDYVNTGFGLRDNENRSYSLGVDVVPSEFVAAGVTYVYDRFSAAQASRAASPGNLVQFADPTRNWSVDTADKAHTLTADLDLFEALLPRTDLRFSWDLSRSTATYVHRTPAGSTLAPLQQLPAVRNDLRTGTADVRYYLTDQIALGMVYWYERYDVNDFALSPESLSQLNVPSTLLMGWMLRPYTAHSAWLRLTYLW